MFQRVKKIGISLFAIIVSLLVLLFILPYLFPSAVERQVKLWANQSITGKLDFENSKLSFFKHFPSLTLSLDNVILKGAAPFEKDTLIAARELAFGINLWQLAKGDININKIFLEDGRVSVLVNEEGLPNYNIFKTSKETVAAADTVNTDLKLENIVLNNINLTYVDRTIPILITAQGLNYKGNGDLSSEEFDLKSRLKIDAAILNYDGTYYIKNQSLAAKLNTRINTKSLQLEFKDNGFLLNKLPVRFDASVSLLADGYDFNFDVKTKKSAFEDLLSAIPQTMGEWLDKTKVKGDAQLAFTLKGKYIPSQNLYPDLTLKTSIYKGYIKYTGAPMPVSDIELRFDFKMPQLNTDSMQVKIDTLIAKLGTDHLSAKLETNGLERMFINGDAQLNLQFEQWVKALGITDFRLSGNYIADLKINGYYHYGADAASIRKKNKLYSIPAFVFKSDFKNGSVKFAGVSQSIDDIQFKLNASNSSSNWKDTRISIDQLNAKALNSIIHGFFHINKEGEEPVNAAIQSTFSLKEFQEFIPLDSTFIQGDLTIDLVSKGNIDLDKNIFPVSKALFLLKDGLIQTKYYPTPIRNIQVEVEASDDKGSLSDLKVEIKPISFELAGLPFFIKANFENFDDIHYNLISKGKLDIGTLYKVFHVDGYNVNGTLDTDFFMKGKASDIINGKYNQVESNGKLEVNDIYLTAEVLPKPLHLYHGVFTFDREKMRFNNFKAKYASADLELNGYFLNMLNWMLLSDQKLEGSFTLKAPYLNVDEWMVYSDQPVAVDTAKAVNGVVMLPSDMKLKFEALVDKINYNQILLTDFKGAITLDNSILSLKETMFKIAGATIRMNGNYQGLTPLSAQFDYAVKADSFDIQNGYKSIPIFRELAPAAKNAYGLIGLDYKLSGLLNEEMFPVLSSLKGGGTISVKDVKLLGFKLMNAVSKSAENDELKDPALKGVNIVSKIDQSIITIEPVKMRIAGFRPKFQGQMAMDGRVQMKGRIGLPPLGIFGIPFNISGTSDNPVVKLKRGPDNKPLTVRDDSEADEEEVIVMDSTAVSVLNKPLRN
jgi:AsmA protein